MIPATKTDDCKHRFQDHPRCSPAYRNTYECPCGNSWDDEWSCACDDECSECRATVLPTNSVIVASCACAYL